MNPSVGQMVRDHLRGSRRQCQATRSPHVGSPSTGGMNWILAGYLRAGEMAATFGERIFLPFSWLSLRFWCAQPRGIYLAVLGD